MGVQFDWEIEAEGERIRGKGDDPEAVKRRARAFRRFVLVVALLFGGVGAVAGVVTVRLRQVDAQIEQNLRDTVDAEIASLRVGDANTFLSIQRSANDDWLVAQQDAYNRYQALKTQPDVQLTGRVIEATVDGQRGRVLVEEIIGGVPYGRAWFYWRFEDGWRHVPPDYTFWGEARTATRDAVTVEYRAVDQAFAHALATALAAWLRDGCAALACADVPPFSAQIVPDAGQGIAWANDEAWRLIVPSPYLDRARLDQPFEPALQMQVAPLVARRLVTRASGGLEPAYPADAFYLLPSVESWLVKRFTGQETNAFLIDSLARQYGEAAVGRLVAALQPASDMGAVAQAAGVPVESAGLDWRDFFTWRLALENELIARRDESNFLTLYHTGDEGVRALAYARFDAGASVEPRIVTAVAPTSDPAVVNALAQVTDASGAVREESVLFRFVDGVWRRGS